VVKPLNRLHKHTDRHNYQWQQKANTVDFYL
jgi:hypothetical protein